MAKVHVIILNWNGWKDTIQCLESVLRSDFPDFCTVVCDNRSSDDSLEKIQQWAEGKLPVDDTINDKLKPFISPPLEKPIPYVLYQQTDAENGGTDADQHIPLVLIQNESNAGFSAGNNPGIRLALHKKADYIWLLNNDTIVTPNTLKEMVYRIQSNKSFGLVGAIIYYTANPSKIQMYGGGKITPFLGLDRPVFSPGKIHYISGTSLLIKRETIEQTGLLDEGFFFFWEDVDFSKRALEKGWDLAVSTNATVYHKFSASVVGRSLKADLYKAASLTRYFKKHHRSGWVFPVVFNISGMIVKRLLRGQWNRIIPIIKESWLAFTKV